MEKGRKNISDIILLLWAKRKLLVRNCSIAFLVAVIVAFSIPKQFTSDVVIAPELSMGETGLAGGLSNIAEMAGINLGNLQNEEAIYPDLYPQIVTSTPVLQELLKMQVESKDGDIKTTLRNYLEQHQRQPWWSAFLKWVLSPLRKKTTDHVNIEEAETSQLSRDQLLLLEGLARQLDVKIGKVNSLITVSATMQDPLIAATMAQALSEKIQKYIDQYHTVKERDNIAYLEGLYQESLRKAQAAQRAYAAFADSHVNSSLAAIQTKQEALENEVQLTLQVYNQVSQQLEAARAKLQDKKPIFVVIQPAVVPYKASSPKKILIAVIFVFFTFFFTLAWLLMKEEFSPQHEASAILDNEVMKA